ncbi:hypothetical protein L1987_35702 [Smallanthus sonchifolius]|uniref:Uncharacterized protein n=1 Tax=Smallanthus sonchifolius TaxID=185202 RepID=A0ACB9HB74_9ASTR|nr:hypothetical protein L1987_35702 [Smallanthus sonchifolius]
MSMMKVALFICIIITLIFSCSSKTTTGSINWWCTQTPHYQTCNHYVAESNTSISINQFLDMTVQAAIYEARVVLKQAQGIEANYPNAPGKSLWRSCVDYFDGIVFTLNMVFDPTNQPSRPVDVHTWLSAGLTYINVCEKGFEMINVTNTMLPAIITNLTQQLLNSLAVIVAICGINSSSNSNSTGLHEWNFSNEYALSGLPTSNISPDVVVAQDGSGNFTTVQEAVNSAGHGRGGKRYVIYVKRGVYEEQVIIPHDITYITMFGAGINKTIITGNRHAGGDSLGTPNAGDLKNSATFQVWGRKFNALYMTFRNTAGPEGGQAVAFLSGSDKSALYRCSFEGYQDTLFAYHSKQLYKECKIMGTIDFIFGGAQAVFQDCSIYLRKPRPGGGLVVTANGRKYLNESGGYSLQGCKITAAHDLKPVVGRYKKAFLGRPWFPCGRAVYMQSFLDELVDPQGWLDSWGFNNTAYCGEYKNYGPGSSTDQRVNWRGYHDITDPNIAEHFTVAEFIAGNRWLPGYGVPYIPGFENL